MGDPPDTRAVEIGYSFTTKRSGSRGRYPGEPYEFLNELSMIISTTLLPACPLLRHGPCPQVRPVSVPVVSFGSGWVP